MNTLEQIITNTPDGSVKELIIGDVLDQVDFDKRSELIPILCKKIRYDGHLELHGTELQDLVRATHQGYLDIPEANSLLFGHRKSVDTLDNMVKIIEQRGFRIINKRANKYTYFIRAQRISHE